MTTALSALKHVAMPRKKNGFGSFGNSGFKPVNSKISKGKGTGAFGTYPGNRSFGSTVTRSVIEQYDLDSTWSRWRRGMEYFYQGAYLQFSQTNAVMYQGTGYEIPVTFDGHRFATKNADSRTHYAIRRTIDANRQLGFVTEIQSDQFEYPDQYLSNEIYIQITASRDLTSDEMLVRSEGERITDGTTAANITEVLTSGRRPAIYKGKSPKTGSTITVTVPLDEIRDTQFVRDNDGDLESLVGEAVYMPDFYTARPLSSKDIFRDFDEYWTVEVEDPVGGVRIEILDNTTALPPTLGEIESLDKIYKTANASGDLKGDFIFKKAQYQRRWGKKYLTADLVRSQVDTITYSILPWTIGSILVDEANNQLALTSLPFRSSCELLTPEEQLRWIVCNSISFTREYPDYKDGVYQHQQETPDKDGDINEWRTLDLDVNPWQDEIFITGRALVFADLYTCSCPAYLHAIIRSPETMGEDGQLNRQQRAPLPTAKSPDTYDQLGLLDAASIAQTWSTISYKRSFKLCKHTVASMFINKIRVQEPNTFPSSETREKFEDKLAKDIREVADEFLSQLRRSEITTVEIVYALADALNLDDTELGYVLLTSNF